MTILLIAILLILSLLTGYGVGKWMISTGSDIKITDLLICVGCGLVWPITWGFAVLVCIVDFLIWLGKYNKVIIKSKRK